MASPKPAFTAAQPENRASFPPLPAEATQTNLLQRLLAIIVHSVQWGGVWLLGWAPLGVFMALIWEDHRAIYRQFSTTYSYSSYVPWGQSYSGAVTGFAIGGLIAGLIAGALLKSLAPGMTMNAKKAAAILALWVAGLALAMLFPSISFYSELDRSDDQFAFFIVAAMPLIAAGGAWLLLRLPQLVTEENVSGMKTALITLGWAVSGFIGFVIAMLIIDV
jgi:hypothetical protein